jgi:hypothetical protein
MSSEQITAERPHPDGEPPCPHCGAEMQRPSAARCWLCHESLAESSGMTPRRGPVSSNISLSQDRGDNPGFILLALLALLISIGLALEAPGILVILLIVALPALIRTALIAGRGQSGGPLGGVGTFLSSLGIMVMVGLASVGAFFTTCFVVCLGGLGVTELGRGRNYDWIWVASIGAGLVPGLLVAGLLLRRLWTRKG